MTDKKNYNHGNKPETSPSPNSADKDKIIIFNRKTQLSAEEYTEGILAGNRSVLSRAITLIESTLPEHNKLAAKIIDKCLPHTGNSVRIGITGVPGVGKSTLIESFGLYLTTELKRTVAVLAIDPTSERSKGSILGDKVRMDRLSQDPNAYIRPTPSSGSLGGVAQNTREAILLCEAAGFNTIIVETVGVGQSETTVNSMVDFFLLLLLAGAGDELQGIKRGIMEMADAITITKADGTNKDRAELAKKEFRNAVTLYPPKDGTWTPEVLTCSCVENEGITKIWELISKHHEQFTQNGQLELKRKEQLKTWMHEAVLHNLHNMFFEDNAIKAVLPEMEEDVTNGKLSPFTAAQNLLEKYYKSNS